MKPNPNSNPAPGCSTVVVSARFELMKPEDITDAFELRDKEYQNGSIALATLLPAIVWHYNVASFKIGYGHVVLILADGVVVRYKRHALKGFAVMPGHMIDAEAATCYPLHGDDFQRVHCDPVPNDLAAAVADAEEPVDMEIEPDAAE